MKMGASGDIFACESAILKQCITALTALLLHLSMGICHGFSAVLIPQLQSKNSTLQITHEEESWIASTCMVSMPVAAVCVGVLMDMYGRKRTIQAAFVPLFLGWGVISQANSVWTLCVGRMITGFAVGMDPAVIIYIAETNMPKYRGIFLSLTGPSILVGILTSYILGHYLYWPHAALILAIFSALCFILCFILPESPVWLVAKDRVKEAVESLKWFHAGAQIADTELQELKNAQMLNSEEDTRKMPLFRKVMLTKAWKPLGILTFFFCVQQFTGTSIIFYYAVNFYASFGTPVDGFVLSVIYIALSLLASLVCTAIIERYNRKTMTIISSAGVGAACAMAAVYEYFFEKIDEKPLFWFPIACMWVNVVFSTLGLNPLPWLMAGELFPSHVRGAMSGLLWALSYFFMFVTVKLYPITAMLVNVYGVLGIFAGSALVGVFFGIYILPETRGKTLIEIENFW